MPKPIKFKLERYSRLAKMKSPDAIANYFSNHHIKGRIFSPYFCPVANYTGAAAVCPENITPSCGAPELKNTEAIRLFVIRFDSQEYPDLVVE